MGRRRNISLVGFATVPTSWAATLALLLNSFLPLVLSGCAGGPIQSPLPQQVSLPVQPKGDADFCGASVSVRQFTNEYLYAGDLFGAPQLTVFKIDTNTGALTEMPWSPMQTFNGVLAGTTDASGKYLYLASRAPFGLNHQPIGTLETYGIPADDSMPSNLGYIAANPSDITFALDPQAKFFYMLPRDGTGQGWQVTGYGPVSGANVSTAGTPTALSVAYPTTYAYKGKGNLLLIAHGTDGTYPPGGITVYRQNCANGNLDLVKENALPGEAQFLSAPTGGDLIVGWYCGGPHKGYQYRVDSQTGTVASIPGNPISGLCEVYFDKAGEYAAGAMNDANGFLSVLVLYRVDASRGLVETDRYAFPMFNGSESQTINSVAFDASGSFVYSSSPSYLVALKLDRSLGRLTVVPGYPQARQNNFKPLFIVAR